MREEVKLKDTESKNKTMAFLIRQDVTNKSLLQPRTPNEGIDQRYLKIWADVADKICFGRT